MKNNYGKQVLKGNITIEAAIIVPFILLVLTALLLASVLLHDVYVIKTDHTLGADRWVISGEKGDVSLQSATVIITPRVVASALEEKYIGANRFRSEVVGSGVIYLLDLVFDASDVRDYVVKAPKDFIRGIDFVDDASDMWVRTREVKEGYKAEVEAIEDLLRGK